jgi:hypothetical protein
MRRAFIVIAACVLVGVGRSASAQDSSTQAGSAPQSQGPLIIERINDTFVIAPEYKVTNLDKEFGQLAGLSAGRLLDEKLLVGGAVYWLANNSRDFKLTYGGVVVGWSSSAGSRVRFGARGLAGVGTATLGTDIAVFPTDVIRFGSRGPSTPRNVPSTIRVLARDDFAVLEPQGDLQLRVTEHVGIGVSAGYRFTGFEDALKDRLDGATGSLALQFGW